MLGNPVSQTLVGNQAQVRAAQLYMDQAHQQKMEQQFEVAFILYDQAKVTFRHAADARQLFPLSEVKNVLNQARTSQTHEEEALRHRIAEVYFERAELLEKLGKSDKAQASYKKAQAWGYEGIKLTPTALVESLSVQDAPASAQKSTSTFVPLQPSSAHEKSELVDYLFEKALLTLSSLEVSKKPSLFLVYAHDNDAHGEAKASTSKYLINNLSKIRGVTLYSDQTPIGQAYSSSVENLKEDGKLEDILTNQFCLLPAQVRADVKPVDKVIVCCSDVLGSYLKGQSYKAFCAELKVAYDQDREAYVKDGQQKGTPALREAVRKFSQEEKYMADFHHVLTEMAFLEIRAEHLKGQHGIIPVSLTPNSYDYCLKDFIDSTTVRMEDPLRFDLQVKKGEEVYLNQGSHGVLFKVIERLLAGSDEAKTFLDKFWTGHSHVISRLKSDLNFGKLEFAKLLDGIFDGIRTALHSQLAFTVQQQHYQLRVLNADPRATLKAQYIAAFKQDVAFEQTLQLYIEPRGKASLQATDTFELLSQVQAFLNDKKVILLTGDSGAGKTTLNRLLEKHLWDTQKEQAAIPLFISLPSIDRPEYDLIAKALKKRGLSEFQIKSLKEDKQEFVFILDGYDEIRQTQNLYLHNRINQPDGWQGHMVISCRSEYLGQDYRSRFQPNPQLKDEDSSFQEVVVEPFSEEERNAYIDKYVAHHPTGWLAQRYQEALEQPHLKDLVSNPFLLRVVLEALPYLDNKGKTRSAVQLRLDLYDQFVRQWFDRNQQRLSTQDLTGTKRECFRALCDDDFAEHGIEFVQNLAVHLYTENTGNPVVEYSLRKDKENWKNTFFGREEEKQLLREAWPLIRSGNQYRFIHKSLLEYCVARSLFESFDACMARGTSRRHSSSSDASVYSFENEPIVLPQTLKTASLAPKHWVGDLGVVRLLTDCVQQEAGFKKQLLSIIERSKSDKTVRQAAANAMTILVRAGVQFHGMDLKGIQIPGANLTGGVFDSAQLQGSDLRNVKLRTSWLHQTNLSGAQMAGVQFGEWPYLKEESRVYSCVYSPDGTNCAMSLESGLISVYNTLSWKKIDTIRGHKGPVYSVAYSPNGQQIASGSQDNTVRLWDTHTGAAGHILEGHTDNVYSVVYSPSGAQIASGSYDKTVRLWNAHTGAAGHTLKGHTNGILSVVYSPSGAQIASASYDKTVRLWDAHSGTAGHILEGHTDWVSSMVYSPSGAQIASASQDKTVRLWDAHSGAAELTLEGHTGRVNSVVYSPSGAQIASGSLDKTVRLWDAHSGAALHTLEGHTADVKSVVYSPSGAQIASGSIDNTMRLWDAHSGAARHSLEGHTDGVHSVVYSPSGAQIASGSWDQTVRLWDVHSGAAGLTLVGHTKAVNSVVYSPSEAQIASGSYDKTVRLWDAHTGAAQHSLEGHTSFVYSVVYSPSGAQIASGSQDNTVRLWDAHSGAAQHSLEGHTDGVTSVAYSPSGAQIASGSQDNTVRLWDAHSGAARHSLEGHTDGVRSVAYSPSGAQIASGSLDNTVRLWEVASGECLRVIEGFSRGVNSVAWKETLEGAYLLAGSGDKFVRQWQVIAEGSGYHARLRWMSPHGGLRVTDSVIDGVKGLSETNMRLLKQRGAVVEKLTLNNLAAVGSTPPASAVVEPFRLSNFAAEDSSPSADQSSGPRLNKTLKFWSKSR